MSHILYFKIYVIQFKIVQRHMTHNNNFSAVNPALGYLYQVQVALLWSLRKLKSSQDFLVSIEILDDVAFEENNGNSIEFLQTKHHCRSSGNLTDSSTDIWKTFRVWMSGLKNHSISADNNLYLISTSIAPTSSAASYLKINDRDINRANQLLKNTANSSQNIKNSPIYQEYLNLSANEQKSLLSKVYIVDGSPQISEIGNEIRHEIFWAVDKNNYDSFIIRLEGWWNNRVIQQLTNASNNNFKISSSEIESYMNELREQFHQESLPVDDDLITFILDDATEELHKSYKFVQQLDIIKVGKQRIATAIRDYYRVYEQRSRWVREHLLVDQSLKKYEGRLIEEWAIVFNAMLDDFGEETTNEEKQRAARDVLKWAERTIYNIRPQVTEAFISRGSFHIASDDLKIGWHPDFEHLLFNSLKS